MKEAEISPEVAPKLTFENISSDETCLISMLEEEVGIKLFHQQYQQQDYNGYQDHILRNIHVLFLRKRKKRIFL